MVILWTGALPATSRNPTTNEDLDMSEATEAPRVTATMRDLQGEPIERDIWLGI